MPSMRLLSLHIYRRLRLVVGLGLLLIFTLTATPPTDLRAQVGQVCFSETGHCIAGRIREFWEQNGGVRVFGFPIAPQQEAMIEGQPRQVQWFERVRLELHPENDRPYDVQLGRLGADLLVQQGRNWRDFPQATGPLTNCRFFPETSHNVCGEFLAFWQSNGLELNGLPGSSLAESLALFGLPLSEARTERLSDGETRTVQWFERARLELHPENAPPFDLLSGHLGRELAAVPGVTGQIAFSSDRDDSRGEIYLINADGSGLTRLTNSPGWDDQPAWSPDGRQLAFVSDRDGDPEIFVMNADGSDLRQLTSNTFREIYPAWSPDGTWIAFQSDRDTPFGGFEIYLMNASGSEPRRLTNVPSYDGCPAWITGSRLSFLREQAGATAIFITTADGAETVRFIDDAGCPNWTRDGLRMAFPSMRNGNRDIYVVEFDGFGLTQLTSNPLFDGEPSWSPDGRYIAFRSNRDANAEIYVMQADGTGQVNITHSLAGDSRPAWRP